MSSLRPHKTFRAIVCSILAVLIFIHTTPLYAQDNGGGASGGPMAGQDLGLSASAPTMYSSTGAATYSIPIEVPKGRGGISPNLAITYNSYQGNGWIGMGFLLDMGAIQRSNKTPGGLTYTNSDQFVATANGSVSNLVPRSDSQWGGGNYENQIDGAFLNYNFNGSSWQVTDKSGTVYSYGSTSASQQGNGSGHVFKWLLDTVQDVNGNFMTVTYQYGPTDNQLYLKEIDYTGNGSPNNPSLQPTNKVVFTLESTPRNDVSTSYASQWAISTAYRLSTISVYGNGAPARTYQLNYAYSSSSSGRSLLQTVTQLGTDGTSLPPVTFTWSQNNTPGLGAPVQTGFQSSYLPSGRVVDLNGDGKADIIYASLNPQGIPYGYYVLLSTGSGFSAVTEWLSGGVPYNANAQYFQLADLNRDGLPDLVYIDSSNRVHVALNNGGNGFGPDTILTGLSVNPKQSTSFKLIDVNGDGIPDLVWDNGSSFNVLLGDGNGGFSKGSWSAAPRSASYYTYTYQSGDAEYLAGWPDFQVADVNGDGLADIVYVDSGRQVHVLLSTGSGFGPDTVWGGVALSPGLFITGGSVPFALADINGDGLADFVYNGLSGNNAYIQVLLSTGSGFQAETTWCAYPGNWGSAFQLADLNGDGLPDAALMDYTGTYNFFVGPYVMLNTGSGLIFPQEWDSQISAGALFGDFNGDGISDVVISYFSGLPYASMQLAQGPVPDLITGISNGVGGSYAIQYTPSSAWPTDQKMPFILQTVSSITAYDGVNPSGYATNITYSGAYYDLANKEFRGFADVKKTLPDGTTVDSTFVAADTPAYNGFIFKGLMLTQTISGTDGTMVSQYNTYQNGASAYQAAAGSGGSYFPCLTQTVTTTTNSDGTTQSQTTTSLTYDSYGNLAGRDQVDNFGGAPERYDQIDYGTYNTSSWLMARPNDVIVKNSSGGAQLSKTTFAYVQGTNLVQSKTFWLNGTNDPVISYTYDNYGNVLTQTDPNGNLTQTAYDTTSQTFPAVVTNSLGQQGTITYDYRFGKPIQKTDPNSTQADPVVTSYYYDVFGRLTTVVSPLGYTKYYSYNNLGTVGVSSSGQNVTVNAQTSNGWYTVSTYFDGFGRQISTRSSGPVYNNGPTSISVDTQYDKNGRISQKSYPYLVNMSGAQLETPRYVTYTYDGIGRTTQKTYPAQSGTTSIEAAYSGGLTTTTDQNGNASRQKKRDGFGRLTQVTEVLSGGTNFTTFYQYDPLGNLTLVTDAKGNSTGITYDRLSRKVQMSDPSMGEWSYAYDNNGNLISQTDSKGQTIFFQYDGLSRPSCKIYPDGNTISYFYDDMSSYSLYGAQANNFGTGRLAEVVDNREQNSSGTTRFFYDKQGRTTQVQRTINGAPYITQFQYDPLGRVVNIAYPDNDQANYTYDAAGNMTSVSNMNSASNYAVFSGYNAFGQVAQVSFPMNGVSTTFQYEQATNRLHELTTAIPASGTAQDFVYGYDNNGNILSIQDNVDPTQSQAFQYDWLNRLTNAQGAYGNLSYNPDATGDIDNPATANSAYKQQQQALTFDYDNRIEQLISGGATNSFVYDYTGARVMKNNTVTYVNKFFEIRNGINYKYIFAGGRRIATIIGTSIYFCHPDHLGSLRIATDINANKVQTIAYDPYGNVDPNHSSGSIIPYTFTGKELDSETGLYYFGARYYDSAQGRFITPDTIVQSPGNPQTLNRYSYAGNNPLAFVDPSGHFFGIDDLIIAICLGALIGAVSSDIAGGNPALGALTGAISGAAFCAAGGIIGDIEGLQSAVQAGQAGALAEASAIHFLAGAASGAINTAITGGNVGMNALISGLSAGVAQGVAGSFMSTGWFQGLAPQEKFFAGLAASTTIGSLVGGATAELVGGKFLQGMGQGAWTAAFGFLFNDCEHGFCDGSATPPPGADPDTYPMVAMDASRAWAAAVNNGNDDTNLIRNLAIVGALPATPLVAMTGPELYASILLYPEIPIAGTCFLSSFNPGVTPPPMVGRAGLVGGALSVYGSFRGWW